MLWGSQVDWSEPGKRVTGAGPQGDNASRDGIPISVVPPFLPLWRKPLWPQR